MSKLSWDYSGDEQRAEYRGFTIRAINDTDCSDPIADRDGHWPMIKGGNRDCNEMIYDGASGVPVAAPLDRFTDEQLVHDQKAIADILPYADIFAETGKKWCTDAYELRRLFEDDIGNVDNSHKLATFEALYGLLGIACLNTTARGYCQGDWADLLIVATPEAIKELRPDVTPDELAKDMQQQADLWEAWAFGNVWGYVIGKPELDEDGDETGDFEEIEDGSCWGFYGDPSESGLEETAIAEIDAHIAYAAKQRQAKLKDLIRNRVPLHLREQLLKEAA